MSDNEFEVPPAEIIEALAEKEQPKIPLRDYRSAMLLLREKKFSYQDIADWLTEKLNIDVTRSQVSYVLNSDPQAEDEKERAEQEMDALDEETRQG